MITGALGILLVFATLSFEVVHFYNTRARLDSVARQIANYAGIYMPNPMVACRRAFDALHLFQTDLYDGSEKLGTAPQFKIWFEMPDGSANPAQEITGRDQCTDTDMYTFPIGALHVQIDMSTNFESLRLLKFGDSSNWSGFNVSGHATARIAPTDVMLVIENSNSVVSPHAQEAANAQGASFDLPLGHPFTPWRNIYTGYLNQGYADAADTTIPHEFSVAQMRVRQCFGVVHRSLKLAALRVFDYLTSSNSFRVGVLHTLSPGGEFNFPSIGISSDSYSTAYTPIELSSLNLFPAAEDDADPGAAYFTAPPPYYGSFDNPQARCAAMAQSGANGAKYYEPEPDHPLKELFGGYLSWPNPSNMVTADNSGVTLKSGNAANGVKFLPRDLIWTANAGMSGAYNMLDQRFDFTPMQFAILRARDVLTRAPLRADKLPVKRRMVLVFTDGFDDPVSDFNPNSLGIKSGFTRVASDTSESGEDFNTKGMAVPLAGGTPVAGTLPWLHNYCATTNISGENPIDQETQVLDDPTTASGQDYKLGIFYFKDRSSWKDGDPLNRLAHVPRHEAIENADIQRIDSFRKYCNTPWAYDRGRFMLETSSSSSVGALSMAMAAALFSTELVED